MADVLRLVFYDEQDQLVPLLDLEREVAMYRQRGTFTVTPGPRQASLAAGEGRRAGARQVSERRDNGTVGATWTVKGATADEALGNVEALLGEADSARIDRYLQWRPEGASRSVLYPIRGAATVEALSYQWVEFAQTYAVGVQVSWPVAPWAEEPRMDMADDFRARDSALSALQQFQADYQPSFTPTSVVQGTVEMPANLTAAQARLPRLDRRAWQDGWVTVKGKAKTAAASLDYAVTPGLRYNPVTGYYFYASLDGGNLRVRFWNGAVSVLGNSVVRAAPAADTSYWLRIRADGALITAEYWTTLPSPHGTPASTVSHTFNLNPALWSGYPMVVSQNMAAGATNIPILESLEVRPYTWRLVNTPAVISVPALPGSLDATVDVDLTTATSDTDFPRHLALAWRRALPGRSPGTAGRSLLLEGATPVENGGGAVATDATKFRGASGQAWRFTLTNAEASAWADYRVDPTILEPDDFAGDITVAIMVRYVRSSSAIVSLRMRAELRGAVVDNFLGYTPEHGLVGRYLPNIGTGARTTLLGTLRLPVDQPELVDLRVLAQWSVGTTAGVTVDVDEIYLLPLTTTAIGAVGKARDDGTYTPVLPANGYTRRIRTDRRGELAPPGGLRRPSPVNLGGADLALPVAPEGVELLVRPSAAVPDDPVTVAADALAHNATVHLAVTPRHRLVPG